MTGDAELAALLGRELEPVFSIKDQAEYEALEMRWRLMTTEHDIRRVRNEAKAPHKGLYWLAAIVFGWGWVVFVVLAVKELAR